MARAHRVDLIGEPRLVRLNPNVPFKTRGNAALSARFGQGTGAARRVGVIDEAPVLSYARGRPLAEPARRAFLAAAWEAVRAASDPSGRADPALVSVARALPSELYYRAVRTLVPVADVRRLLAGANAEVRTSGSDQGLVGAAAAIAWPGRRATWERIAYRAPARVGTLREVGAASVRDAQRRDPRLFLCYDGRTRRVLVAPHTRCPILYGLRATDRRALAPAARRIRSEPVERWVEFRTNQGTGDHAALKSFPELGEYATGRVRGTVIDLPQTLRGGHVRFTLSDAQGRRLDCIAFEPTKTLPDVARSLLAGDRVSVWGGRSKDPTFRVEGIVLSRPSERRSAVAPRCPECGTTARSLGRDRGFRCRSCRRRWPPEARRRARASSRFPPGTYHPTPSARRHLAPRGPEVPGPVVDL